MRSSRLLCAAALAALCGCSVRGTGPDSVEVGAQCDAEDDLNGCEEVCLSNANMCVFRCASDADCPVGSACTALRFSGDDGNANICLPRCRGQGPDAGPTAPCLGYEQGLCCGPMTTAAGTGSVSVCYTTTGGSGFACSGVE